MQTDTAQVISFPQPKRQLGRAELILLPNGEIEHCRLVHNDIVVKVVGVVDIPHRWHQQERVFVIHNNNRAIIIGCESAPDNSYNLNFHFGNKKIDLEFGFDTNGIKLNYYHFLCGQTIITIKRNGELFLDVETLDNNGFWCLNLIGFQHYVI